MKNSKQIAIAGVTAILLCNTLTENVYAEGFTSEPISDEVFERIEGKTYKENCTVPLEDLRYLKILYRDFEGESQEGEMIVNQAIAEDVLEIFEGLYAAEYPIERIVLADVYDADDELSMTDNNTSAFNFRMIEGTDRVSKHGLGLAIDVNPLYNPYVKETDEGIIVLPAAGEKYADRTGNQDHMIDEDDLCYQLFTEHGFEWGGSWNSLKDYQHFELPSDTVNQLYP